MTAISLPTNPLFKNLIDNEYGRWTVVACVGQNITGQTIGCYKVRRSGMKEHRWQTR